MRTVKILVLFLIELILFAINNRYVSDYQYSILALCFKQMEVNVLDSVTVILTCYNRKIDTQECVQSLSDSNLDIRFLITDDASTDGTGEMLEKLKNKHNIQVLKGNGKLFWSGGMRKAIEFAKQRAAITKYYVFVNDDVKFYPNVISKTIEDSKLHKQAVIVGITKNKRNQITYGGVKYLKKSIYYNRVECGERCDTFNCNYVLLPSEIFMTIDNFDSHFTHSMADFDYGLQITKIGYPIYSATELVGICENNEKKETWQDINLSPIERIRLKESVKGLPMREWFYFLKKNFGLKTALVRSVTPYAKIILRR